MRKLMAVGLVMLTALSSIISNFRAVTVRDGSSLAPAHEGAREESHLHEESHRPMALTSNLYFLVPRRTAWFPLDNDAVAAVLSQSAERNAQVIAAMPTTFGPVPVQLVPSPDKWLPQYPSVLGAAMAPMPPAVFQPAVSMDPGTSL